MDTALATLLTSLAVTAHLDGRLGPDDLTHTFLEADLPVPLVLDDPVFGTDAPTGLLLAVPALRRAGVRRLRLALVHPTLPLRVPRVDREARRAISRSSAVAVAEVGAEGASGVEGTSGAGDGGESVAVVVLDGEANLRIFPCARVRYATVDTVSVAESARTLREAVMAALSLVETHGQAVPEGIRNLQWRDWQADMSAEKARGELSTLLDDPAHAILLQTALDVHQAFSGVLAPASLQPPELGAALDRVHKAAAGVITAVSREHGVG
ncbi:hypothetical protein [Brevibacterium litoralis]|uniref:hypothetical protein n=1 Tax=Brevibacterium litoralis TaxID=3138935 RepID=UPI0032ECC3D4